MFSPIPWPLKATRTILLLILFHYLFFTSYLCYRLNTVEHRDEHSLVSEYIKPHDEPSPTDCNSIPYLLSNHSTPFDTNRIRRQLALHNPTCLSQHLHLFITAFHNRHVDDKRHINLHIPNAGGTSLCSIIHNSSLSEPSPFCWTGDFCPLWCGCLSPKPTTCSDLQHQQYQYDFLMNENYLDHPLCPGITYSILLREPITRAISHVNHFLDAVARRGHEHFHDTKGWRISLIQANYITWSLVSGLFAPSINVTDVSTDVTDVRTFQPTMEHIKDAKHTLSGLDFVLDLSMNSMCLNNILRILGVKLEGDHPIGKRNSYSGNYQSHFRRRDYELLNQLDVGVYEYALELMRVDCEFFESMGDLQFRTP